MPRDFVIDGHQDIAWHMLYHNRGFSVGDNPRQAMITLDALLEGRILLSIASVFVEHQLKKARRKEIMNSQFRLYEKLAKNFTCVRSIESKDSLKHLRNDFEAGKEIWGFCLMMEGADLLDSEDELEALQKGGLRLLSLTWNEENQWAGGAKSTGGLSKAGRALLSKMRELGTILDVSHLNEKSFWQVLDAWDGPVVATHSNAHSLCTHPRNLKDDQLREIGMRGGVVGILLYNGLLDENWSDGSRRLPISVPVRHILHVLAIVGCNQVAIGSDFDGGISPKDTPEGMNSVSDLWLIANELNNQGIDDSVIQRVMGLNWYEFLLRNLGDPLLS